MLSLCLFVSFFVRFAAPLSTEDFFYYPEKRFCASGGCLDFEDDGVMVVDGEPFPFYGRQSNRVVASINGIVTFGQYTTIYQDVSLPSTLAYGAVAVFYQNTDLRGGGMMYHQSTDNATSFNRANQLVRDGFADAADFQARKVFVTTYKEVGYFNSKKDKLNSYQSVVATDYNRTFVILLYANISWVTTQSNPSRYAQVGIYSGNQMHFSELPYSGTSSVTQLEEFTNVCIPGLSVYEVSGRTIQPAGCASNYPLRIYPRYGSELGGNLVKFQGHCFSAQDSIRAEFGTRTANCTYVSTLVAACIVPQVGVAGTLTVKLLVNGEVKGQTSYTTLSYETSYGLDLEGSFQAASPSPLLLTSSELVVLTYDPAIVFPGENSNSYMVDILLYGMNLTTGQWEELATLRERGENSGTQSASLPGNLAATNGEIRPVAVFVGTSASGGAGSSTQSSTLQALRGAGLRAGVFTAIYYYADRTSLIDSARKLCLAWFNTSSVVSDAPSCPTIMDQADLPISGFDLVNLTSVTGRRGYRTQWMSTFHPGAQSCYRQMVFSDPSSNTVPSQQECCYDNQGELLLDSPGGGAVNLVAADINGPGHFWQDVRPYLLCCVSDQTSCDKFYQRRPSDSGDDFEPKRPGWVVGDPHFITFDGMKYTFNGFGEFTLLRTHSNEFVVQGRMEPFPDSSSGSILTSIAVKYLQNRINIVTNKVGMNAGGMDVYLNETRVTMDYLPRMSFPMFMLSFDTSRILRISFLNGIQLECRTANGNITQFLVGMPSSLQNMVSGLFGTFNDDKSDDLSPLTPSGSLGIPLENTNIETIHADFGLSWIVKSSASSLFEYFADESFVSLKNESFQPVFDISDQIFSLCNNDFFCAYDAVVTEDINFAQRTLSSVTMAARIQELSGMVVCTPECSNGGTCQLNNVCTCLSGFTGSHCETKTAQECGPTAVCMPPSVCVQQSCQCPEGRSGHDCSMELTATTSASSGPFSSQLVIIIAAAAGAALLVGITISVIIAVVVCRKRKSGVRKDNLDKVDEEYSTTYNAKVNVEKKTSNLSLPPSYSDLNLDNKQNNVQMTRFSMRNSGNGIDTIPEGEPQYDVISDTNYQNMRFETTVQKVQDKSMAASQTPPILPHGIHEKKMVAGDRAQSHNVIPTSPNGVGKNMTLNSCSSNNVSDRSHSQEMDKHWYCSTPSIAASPAHLTAPAVASPSSLSKTGSLPVSQSHHSSQPSTNVITSSAATATSAMPPASSQPGRLSPHHQPVRKTSSSTQSVGSKSGSRPGSRTGSRQSVNRSIPELLNDATLPTSDV